MNNRRKTRIGMLWSHLQTTEVRLWHVVLGFLISTLVSVCVSQSDKRADLVSQRAQELIETSSQFENFVNELTSNAKTLSAINAQSIDSLLKNINDQLSALNRVRPIISSEEDKQTANDYALTLVSLRRILNSGISDENSTEFGSDALMLVKTRDKLLMNIQS